MNSLDELKEGRFYNLFYTQDILPELKRKKDGAIVGKYLGIADICNEAVLHAFSVGDKKLLVYDVEYYRPRSEDIFVSRLELSIDTLESK
jgi:hypothetical protein